MNSNSTSIGAWFWLAFAIVLAVVLSHSGHADGANQALQQARDSSGIGEMVDGAIADLKTWLDGVSADLYARVGSFLAQG